jgi:hypothetical protein
MRDSAGRAHNLTLTAEVVNNPIGDGAVLALVIDPAAQTITDSTGLHTVRLSDAARFEQDGFRYAGKSSFFEIEDSHNFVFEAAFTIRTRFRVDLERVSLPSDIVSLWKPSGNDRSFRLGLTEAGEIAFFWSESGDSEQGNMIVGPVMDGEMHTVMVDRGPSGIVRLYLDGAMVARTEGPVSALYKSPAPLRVSGRPNDQQGSQGVLAELMIFNGVALCDDDQGCPA